MNNVLIISEVGNEHNDSIFIAKINGMYMRVYNSLVVFSNLAKI